MATRAVHVSDISGKPDASTATIGVDGTWHEVDLTASEQDELQHLLNPYVRSADGSGSR